MSVNMAGLVEEIAKLAKASQRRIEKVDARDKVLLVDHEKGDVVEIEPRFEDIAPHYAPCEVVKLSSIIEWAKGFGATAPAADNEPGEVRLARRLESVAQWPRAKQKHEQFETAKKGFFAEFMPPKEWLDLGGFQDWLDRIRPGMMPDHREVIDIAFGSVSAATTQVVELVVEGGVISADVKQGEKIVGKRQIPRHIVSRVPFGDPEFTFDVRFVVTAKILNGGIAFRAAHDPNDGAYDAWCAWAEAKLRADLPEGWVVLVTP